MIGGAGRAADGAGRARGMMVDVSDLPSVDGGCGLVLDRVGVRFDDVVALDGVSLRLPPRSVLGLVGENAVGKTTVLNVISGAVEATSGTVTMDGEPVQPGRPVVGRYDSGRGGTPTVSVTDHVRAGTRTTVGRWRLRLPLKPSAAALATLAATLDSVGISTEEAEQPMPELPLLVQRRAELARVLIRDPALVLLDEPFAGLAHDLALALAATIAEIPRRRDCAVVLVDHDREAVAACAATVVTLAAGRITETA